MKMKKRILWITQTAMLLAIAVISQTYLLMILGGPGNPVSQLVVGSVVNFCLILATLTSGFFSGAAISVCVPLIALLMGRMQIPQQIIVVAFGNLALVFIFWLFCGKKITGKHETFNWGVAAITGAFAKFTVLWFGMIKIIVPFFLANSGRPPQQITNMTAMITITFTWPQLATALTGSILAFCVYKVVKPIFFSKIIDASYLNLYNL